MVNLVNIKENDIHILLKSNYTIKFMSQIALKLPGIILH